MIANPTLGLRSAGALNGVVLLAGPSFDSTAVNVFAFSDDGTYLGMDVLSRIQQYPQWIVYEGVMYTGVSTTGGGRAGSCAGTATAATPSSLRLSASLTLMPQIWLFMKTVCLRPRGRVFQ